MNPVEQQPLNEIITRMSDAISSMYVKNASRSCFFDDPDIMLLCIDYNDRPSLLDRWCGSCFHNGIVDIPSALRPTTMKHLNEWERQRYVAFEHWRVLLFDMGEAGMIDDRRGDRFGIW